MIRPFDTLRFMTCGSVDDGKSTLMGRLLYESKSIYEDQLAALRKDSQQFGTQGEALDFALLVDGLQSEREQGITIDVAYRYFSTNSRRFVMADTPGHEQYTRNMATAASTADLAVILVDARKGVLSQTRRHSRIVSMMGIQQVVLAVSKMDLVNFEEDIFETIVSEYKEFCQEFGGLTVQSIALSALDGGNVMQRSSKMPWFRGPCLMPYLESVEVSSHLRRESFRLPVQWVNRPHSEFRGYCGTLSDGFLRVGDPIRVLPSGALTHVKSIGVGFTAVPSVTAGDAVTLTLRDHVDISRGDVLVSANNPAEITDQFAARLLWMSNQAMTPGRQYVLKIACKEVTATITAIKYLEDINSGAHLAAKTLGLNDIGCVTVSCSEPVVFEPYDVTRTLGSFILIDKLSFETVGAGMIEFALRRADNIHWQTIEVSQSMRALQKNQKARCVWFTGLSGSGKSTVANLLDKRLSSMGRHTYVLDGDNIRHGLNRDLGFTEEDRVENIRRVAEVARLMVDAGLIVLVSFISPFRSERAMARNLFSEDEFLEVFVDTSLEICEQRDVKGLYAKARKGELKNFTGIDSPYEFPESPDVHLKFGEESLDSWIEHVLNRL